MRHERQNFRIPHVLRLYLTFRQERRRVSLAYNQSECNHMLRIFKPYILLTATVITVIDCRLLGFFDRVRPSNPADVNALLKQLAKTKQRIAVNDN